MKEYEMMQLISTGQAARVAHKDAPEVSRDIKNYVKKNIFSYYVLINVWMLLIREYAWHTASRILSLIFEKGLLPVIKIMADEADCVVRESEYGPWAKLLFADVPLTERRYHNRLLPDNNLGRDVTATVLTLLRFPKRFSPQGAELIQEASLTSFLNVNNKMKMVQRRPIPHFLVSILREIVHDMYPWDRIVSEIEGLRRDDIIITPGAAYDAPATALGKWKSLLGHDWNEKFNHKIMGCTWVPVPSYEPERLHIAKVLAVPKSYKAARIIAMEDTYRLAHAKRIEKIFIDFDRKLGGINLEDQSINQVLAQRGSSDGTIATIDLSSASDTISVSLFKEIFPPEYTALVLPLLADQLEVNGKLVTKHMLSSAGHTLTFRHETIVFKALAIASTIYSSLFCETHQEFSLGDCWAYGDDILVPTFAVETLFDFLHILGMIPNVEKSFYSGNYRESCGREYLSGIDVTSIYFPRFPVIGEFSKGKLSFGNKVYNDTYRGKIDNSLTLLIALQHRIIQVCPDAGAFLRAILQHGEPRLTSSLIGEVAGDLWDYAPSDKFPKYPGSEVRDSVSITKVLWFRSGNHNFTKSGELYYSRPISGDSSIRIEYIVHKRAIRVPISVDLPHTANSPRLHLEPRVSHVSAKAPSAEEWRIYELWKYNDFLQHGPRFTDKLSRLLGVTEKPVSFSEFSGKRLLTLKRVIR